MPLDEKALHKRLASIRMLILDVDGVMTDGGVFLGSCAQRATGQAESAAAASQAGQSENDGSSPEPCEFKRFDVRDGTGIKYLMRSGVEVAMISGRASAANVAMARELGIAELHQDARHKLPVVGEILARRGIKSDEVAYVGDDLVDLPVMIRVGLAIAVADAAPEVRQHTHGVTERPGGHGAVREVAEAILRAQGKYEAIAIRYLSRDVV